MNLTALDQAVRARGFSFVPPSSGADDPTNPILIALNATYRQVNGAQRWPWLEKSVILATTTTGMNTYPLSTVSDFRQLDAVRLIDPQGNPLDMANLPPQRFKEQTYQIPQNGVPQVWTQYAGAIQVWPAPDGAYQIVIDYINNPPDLAALGDVPALPAVYHDILVWGAIQELAFRERQIWAQELAMGYYQARYNSMHDEYMLMQRQTASTVEQSGFFDDYSDDWLSYGTGAW